MSKKKKCKESKEKYKIEFATNGFQALDWIYNANFDLILLDVMMPKMDGFEVCEKMKLNPKLDDVPIIFITARNDTEGIVKGLNGFRT